MVKAAGVMLMVVVPVIPLNTALMVVPPGATGVTLPWFGDVLEMVASAVTVDDQTTDVVRVCVLPSLNVPVATMSCVEPMAMVLSGGVTLMDCKVAFVTFTSTEVLAKSRSAVTLAPPTAAPKA